MIQLVYITTLITMRLSNNEHMGITVLSCSTNQRV